MVSNLWEHGKLHSIAGIYPEPNGKIANISTDHRRIISCSTRWAYFPADWKHFWFSDGNVSCWERLQTSTYLIFQRPPHKREMFPPQRTAAASLNANLKFSISLDWASIEKSQLQFADRNFWNVNTMASSPTAFNHKIITRISHRVHTQYKYTAEQAYRKKDKRVHAMCSGSWMFICSGVQPLEKFY